MIRVLLVKPSSLGDIIHAAAPVAAFAKTSPEIHLTWLVNEEFASFVREFPGVAEVLPFARSHFRLTRPWPWIPAFRRLFGGLRGDFDLAIDLQGLQRSALFARMSGAKERYGPRDAREHGRFWYTKALEVPPDRVHAIDRLAWMLETVLEKSPILESVTRLEAPREVRAEGTVAERAASFRLPVAPGAHARLAQHLELDEPYIALCPGTRWPSKTWEPLRWAELVRRLSDLRTADGRAVRAVLLGSASESEEIDAILAEAGPGLEPTPLNLAGRIDLWASAAALAEAELCVALDSAPLHLAAILGTPTLALFGPTSPERVAPRGKEHLVLRREELDCLECYERRCPLEERVCLPGLSAERVLETIEARLRTPEGEH